MVSCVSKFNVRFALFVYTTIIMQNLICIVYSNKQRQSWSNVAKGGASEAEIQRENVMGAQSIQYLEDQELAKEMVCSL